MRDRHKHLNSIVAYHSKNDLRHKIEVNPFTNNNINGNSLALLKHIPDKITSQYDWINFVARCLALDFKSVELMHYMSQQESTLGLCLAKLSYNDYRKWKNHLSSGMSQDAFYMSIKALTMIYCIQKAPDVFMYHVNSTYFVPSDNGRFRVSVYFAPESIDIQESE